MGSNSPGLLVFEILDFISIVFPIYNSIIIPIPFSLFATFCKWEPSSMTLNRSFS